MVVVTRRRGVQLQTLKIFFLPSLCHTAINGTSRVQACTVKAIEKGKKIFWKYFSYLYSCLVVFPFYGDKHPRVIIHFFMTKGTHMSKFPHKTKQ